MSKSVLLVSNSNHSQHDGKMSECAARLETVIQQLQINNLWDRCSHLDAVNIKDTSVSEATISAIHTKNLLNRLRTEYQLTNSWNCSMCTFTNSLNENACMICGSKKQDACFIIPNGKNDCYLCPNSFNVAMKNCAAVIEAAEKVLLEDQIHSSFALIRPPGHHASSESFGSYCLLNTVAITAHHSIMTHKKKVLIMDWDVHHGDGTQAIVESFSEDEFLKEQCRFVSIHRHDDGFWPKSGRVEDGEDAILNIPLKGISFGDADYVHLFEELVIPWAKNFEADLIIVSAGYDCARNDPIGRFDVTANGFSILTDMLQSMSPCIFVLEGGYDIGSSGNYKFPHQPLAQGVCATVSSMLRSAADSTIEIGNDAINPAKTLPFDWQSNIKQETKDVVTRVKQLPKFLKGVA